MLEKPHAVRAVMELYDPLIHSDCSCNERVALHNRVMCPRIEPLESCPAWDYVFDLARRIGKAACGKLSKLEDTDFLSAYSGGKKKRYVKALDQYKRFGMKNSYSTINMFVKPDPFDPVGKGSYDCRAIQGRSPVYNYRLALFIKPFEHWLCEVTNWEEIEKTMPSGRIIAKGLNASERGELLAQKWDEMTHPIAIECDGQRFDMHVRKMMLQAEHSAYKAAWSNDPELKELLSKQLRNRGYSTKQVKYILTGGRASGDINTGCGNSLIMTLLFASFAKWLDDRKEVIEEHWDGSWQFLCDGDDSVFITERENYEAFANHFPRWSSNLGIPMEVSQPITDLRKVSFCQGKCIRVEGKWVLVRDPRKCLSTSMAIKRKIRNEVEVRKHMTCVGICELALNAGIPILQDYAEALRRNGIIVGKRYLDNFRAQESWRYFTHVKGLVSQAKPISMQTRDDFEVAFGWTPAVQQALELEFREWNISKLEFVYKAAPIDPGSGSIIVSF